MQRSGALKDELLLQLCRQTTQNPTETSLRRGLLLLGSCLYYFGPSAKFAPYLRGFLGSHEHELARQLCNGRLRKRCGQSGGVGGGSAGGLVTTMGTPAGGYCRKPSTVEEIRLVRLALNENYGGVFGEPLYAQLEAQAAFWPDRKLPGTLVILAEAILRLQGAHQEGIFRIAGDVDEMSVLKLHLDCIPPERWVDEPVEAGEPGSADYFVRLANVWKQRAQRRDRPPQEVGPVDVHALACILKQWFRELPEPLWPPALYDAALDAADEPAEAVRLVGQLPRLNRLVLAYLIRLLQTLSAPACVRMTKMDDCNLSMVWAPNLLRPAAVTEATLDAAQLFENTRKEMCFVRTLVQQLDTSFVDGVI